MFGASGAGKTTLLHNPALFQIHSGQGVCVIDPRGDLVQDLLERIPQQRTNDVAFLNLLERSHVVGLNLFAPVPEHQRALRPLTSAGRSPAPEGLR